MVTRRGNGMSGTSLIARTWATLAMIGGLLYLSDAGPIVQGIYVFCVAVSAVATVGICWAGRR